jgi:hypothetical protein
LEKAFRCKAGWVTSSITSGKDQGSNPCAGTIHASVAQR